MIYDIEKIDIPKGAWDFTVIAGPCSAESEGQVMTTAEGLAKVGINILRAGLWKPRTMPSGFEGVGDKAIAWIQKVQRELGLKVMTEVGTREHVKKLLDAGLDTFWIGARTTTSPFAVTELAEELAKSNTTVFVKNPLNPDINLWIGAILRLQQAGVKRIGAIHRGFSSYGISDMRNPPYWQIALELRKRIPNITLICDPSHITGKRSMIYPVSQTAIDMGYDGLIIESHCSPDNALSDAAQQITPSRLKEILLDIEMPQKNASIPKEIEMLRRDIDHIDDEIIGLLAQRFELTKKMGQEKLQHNIPVLQIERYKALLQNRLDKGNTLGLREELITQIFATIHEESVHQQEVNFPK